MRWRHLRSTLAVFSRMVSKAFAAPFGQQRLGLREFAARIYSR
jgi:hypothetical protein